MSKILTGILLLLSVYCTAQTFDRTMNVASEPRVIKCYKPAGFSAASHKSLLIALPGMPAANPASAADFRNALVGFADTHDDFLIASPVASAAGNGFFAMNARDTLLLRYVIDSFIVDYGIDPARIYLMGFSANGFSSFLFAMHQFYPFRGVIPFNPALADAYFAPPSFFPNYHPPHPICLCSGTSDPAHPSVVRMRDSLQAHNATYRFQPMQGIGHTYNFAGFTTELSNCFSYFDQVTGISGLRTVNTFRLYPNPASSWIVIEDQGKNAIREVTILNASGMLSYHNYYEAVDKVTVNIAGLPPGIYVVQVKTAGTLTRQQLEILK